MARGEMDHNYVDQEWFLYLTHPMQDLVVQAFGLLSREKEQNNGYHDYSFVVFPLAKAYEGFLKKVLVEMGFSDKETVYGRHFRIGKSLNPDLPKKFRREDWLYAELDGRFDLRGDDRLAGELWAVWREGRNLLFHYFPEHEGFIALAEAEGIMGRIVGVMERVAAVVS